MNDLVLLSEGGAVCGSAARTDLCGGYEVTYIPTATVWMAIGFLGIGYWQQEEERSVELSGEK